MAAANYDSLVSVTTVIDDPSVSIANFGVALIAAESVTFSDRVREYASAAAAAADSELGAAIQAAIAAVYAPGFTPAKVLVGRVDTPTADAWNVAITAGSTGDVFSVVVLGQTFSHTQTGGQTAADIVDDLITLITAASLPVTLTDNGADFDIDGDNAGQALLVSASTDSVTTGVATAVNSTPATTYFSELDLILADNTDWYGLHPESRDEVDILEVSRWSESNKRLALSQSNDSDIIGSATDDVASQLQDASYQQSAVMYYGTDTTWAALALMTQTLAINPDKQTTIWSFKTLTGITPSVLTDTQKGYAEGKNANLYLTIKGSPATGRGVAADGTKLDLVLTKNWVDARIQERVVAAIVAASVRGQKIPFDDNGIGAIGAAVLKVLKAGEAADHFREDSAELALPKVADLSDSDLETRHLDFSWGAIPAGAIESAAITGYISFNLANLGL